MQLSFPKINRQIPYERIFVFSVLQVEKEAD